MKKSLPTVAQIMGKGWVQDNDPSPTEYTLPDIIEKQEPRGAKVFRLVSLATSFLNELEDERKPPPTPCRSAFRNHLDRTPRRPTQNRHPIGSYLAQRIPQSSWSYLHTLSPKDGDR